MGLFNFLKKDKRREDELDLPPPPPSLEGENEPELPEFPEINADAQEPGKMDDFNIEMPKFPDIPDMDTMDAPEELPEEEPEVEEPQVPEPTIPKPVPDMQDIPPVYVKPQEPVKVPVQQAYERPALFAKPSFERPRSDISPRHRRPVFVKIDDFKKILGTISSIRGDLRRSDEALLKLETVKSTKDKSFDKMKYLLEDTQKKLIFMDKTLFKGE